jgi:hypothetical protein
MNRNIGLAIALAAMACGGTSTEMPTSTRSHGVDVVTNRADLNGRDPRTDYSVVLLDNPIDDSIDAEALEFLESFHPENSPERLIEDHIHDNDLSCFKPENQ